MRSTLGVVASSRVRPAVGGGAITHSYITGVDNGANQATYTYSSVSLGAAASDRTIVVVAVSRGTGGSGTFSCTIGGVAATIDFSSGFTGTGNAIMIARAVVPTGTTGDIVVGFGATQLRSAIGVYRIVGGTVTPVADDIARDFSTTPTSLAAASTADGVVLGGFLVAAVATGVTWSTMTKDYDAQIGGEFSTASFASAATSGSSFTVEVQSPSVASSVAAIVTYEGA